MDIAYILSEEEHELLKQDIIKGWLLKNLIDYSYGWLGFLYFN